MLAAQAWAKAIHTNAKKRQNLVGNFNWISVLIFLIGFLLQFNHIIKTQEAFSKKRTLPAFLAFL